MCVLTIFSTLLCLVQLVLVCSLVVLAEQFAKFPVSWIWQPGHDGKLTAKLTRKGSSWPRRYSGSVHWAWIG